MPKSKKIRQKNNRTKRASKSLALVKSKKSNYDV